MIHVLRWLAIIGTIGFFVWVYRKDYGKSRRYPDNPNKREVR